MEPENQSVNLRQSDRRLIRQASFSFMLIFILGLGILILYLSLNSRPSLILGTSIGTLP